MPIDITPVLPAGRRLVQAYGDGGFRISGTVYTGSVIVFPETVLVWPVTAVEAVDLAALRPVADASGGDLLLLLGCGPRLVPVAPAVRLRLKEWGVRVESMDTGAACRTYNVLMAEDRRVCAALIAV